MAMAICGLSSTGKISSQRHARYGAFTMSECVPILSARHNRVSSRILPEFDLCIRSGGFEMFESVTTVHSYAKVSRFHNSSGHQHHGSFRKKQSGDAFHE